METRVVIGLMVLAFVASGCTNLPDSITDSNSNEPEQVPGKGLEVTQFSISDNTLSPDQQAEVTLKLKNFHRKEIDIGEVVLRDTEPLTVSKNECIPEEIDSAEQGVYPVMECSWTVTAPSSDYIGGFSQRKTSFSATIPYNSTIENFQPMKVEFKPYTQINSTDKKIMSFSNGEVQVEVQTESPAALKENKTLGVRVSKAGSGRIDGDFSFEYTPSSLFNGWCPEEKKPVLQNTVEFNCPMRLDSEQTSERNLFFTVHYKYVQAPSMDVTIVNNQ